MWTDEDVLARFRGVRVWRRRGQRAAHKPLLLLMTLARLQRGESTRIRFTEIEGSLEELLQAFGSPRQRQKPEQPFWRLQSDEGLWQVDYEPQLKPELIYPNGDPVVSVLRERSVTAGFPSSLDEYLRDRPELVKRVVTELLDRSFPSSLHEPILSATAFPWFVVGGVRRDPEFRDAVLRAYRYSCAFCGYDGRLGPSLLGLDAVHIRWESCDGPTQLSNGLALCEFHRSAFDRGAITVSEDLTLLVSQEFHGKTNVDRWLLELSGENLIPPSPGSDAPNPDHLRWHREEVFRHPARP